MDVPKNTRFAINYITSSSISSLVRSDDCGLRGNERVSEGKFLGNIFFRRFEILTTVNRP
jgi:hypothetical protein